MTDRTENTRSELLAEQTLLRPLDIVVQKLIDERAQRGGPQPPRARRDGSGCRAPDGLRARGRRRAVQLAALADREIFNHPHSHSIVSKYGNALI